MENVKKIMPFKKIKDVLRQNNLRPTNQRIAIFNILFKEENWHFSADVVEKKCSEKGIKISAGTIYNVLNDLNNAYKERNYEIIHYESPDNRGIDNALLYDKNRFSIISSRAIENKLKNGGPTRDILYVLGEYNNARLHIFVNHWPSNYGGKEKAIPKRTETAQLIIKEIETETRIEEMVTALRQSQQILIVQVQT